MYENYAKVIDLGLQRVCHCIFLTLGSSSSSSSYTLSTFLLLLFPVYRHCYHSSSSIPFFISLWPYESSLLCSSCDWGCYAVAVVALVSCTGTELDRRMLHFELKDRSPAFLIAFVAALYQDPLPPGYEIFAHIVGTHCIHLVIL